MSLILQKIIFIDELKILKDFEQYRIYKKKNELLFIANDGIDIVTEIREKLNKQTKKCNIC